MNFEPMFHPKGTYTHYQTHKTERRTALETIYKFKSALVIEGEEVDLAIITKFLTLKDIAESITGRSNSTEALEYLKGCRRFPELIIVDLVKENKDLLRFLQGFKKLKDNRKEKTKIIIMSAYLEYYISDVELALKYKNVIGSYAKPVHEDSLAGIIENMSKKVSGENLNGENPE